MKKGFLEFLTYIAQNFDTIINTPFILLPIFGFAALLFLYLWQNKTHKTKKTKAISPLFYPPHDMSPADVHYLNNLKYSSKALSAEIVNMAVRGLFTICYTYYPIILKKNVQSTTPTEREAILLKIIFGTSNSVALDDESKKIFLEADTVLNQEINKKCRNFIKLNIKPLFIYSLISSLTTLPLFVIGIYQDNMNLIVLAWFSAIIDTLFGNLFIRRLKTYTIQGQQIQDQIAGFKLFLIPTNQLKSIGTPPTKNTELFEKYLPYAIALGVEEQWTKQFTSVFAQLEQAGTPYIPTWYLDERFNANRFVINLCKSLNTAVAPESKLK